VIDVYFKIRALHAEGVKVHLHCFTYGRSPSPDLNKICESVNYYPRGRSPSLLFGSAPYIVSTRSSEELMKNLMKDDHPILFEGLHCCYYLADPRLKDRKKLVRTHNIEHDYYAALAGVEGGFFKRWYFEREAKRLERFESCLHHASHILAISPADARALSGRYKNVINVIAFHPDEKVNVREGKGAYALYHGNLGIGENNEAALFLVRKVFNNLEIPLVIAGNNPSAELMKESANYPHITVEHGIRTEKIVEMVRDAQVNILPTFQATGIKLKLLSALYNGRHCIVNPAMVANTGLDQVCIVADDANRMKEAVKNAFVKDFDKTQLQKREEILYRDFSNKANVQKILELI
jgi:hypothetical protein